MLPALLQSDPRALERIQAVAATLEAGAPRRQYLKDASHAVWRGPAAVPAGMHAERARACEDDGDDAAAARHFVAAAMPEEAVKAAVRSAHRAPTAEADLFALRLVLQTMAATGDAETARAVHAGMTSALPDVVGTPLGHFAARAVTLARAVAAAPEGPQREEARAQARAVYRKLLESYGSAIAVDNHLVPLVEKAGARMFGVDESQRQQQQAAANPLAAMMQAMLGGMAGAAPQQQ
eukprot:m51a1_g12630 hypothetical protein (237) ;mRNA; r:518-1464